MSKEITRIFSTPELDDLQLAREVRLRIIKEYTQDELPKAFDMDRLLTVTAQLEKGALDVAKIRIKQQEADGADTNNALLAQLLYDMKNSEQEGGNVIEGDLKDINMSEYTLPSELESDVIPGSDRVGSAEDGLYEEIFGPSDGDS